MTTMLPTVSLAAALAAVPTLILADDGAEYHFGFTAGTSVGTNPGTGTNRRWRRIVASTRTASIVAK